jgi:uncharacterized protein
MRGILCLVALMGAFLVPAAAQTTTTATPRRVIRVYGDAAVSVKPDQARLDVGVVTTASTANDAATQNAAAVQSVIDALTKLIGAGANIRTISYSITANYSYPANQGPVLTGYTATNIVELVSGDLSNIGRYIDTAISAGANRVQGLSFSLKDDAQARSQALRQAVLNARAKADVVASALGVKVGLISTVQEGVTTTPVIYGGAGTTATTTPVVSGTVDITATVTLDVEIVQ